MTHHPPCKCMWCSHPSHAAELETARVKVFALAKKLLDDTGWANGLDEAIAEYDALAARKS